MTSKISSLSDYGILVTGAGGFLGRRLVKALLDRQAFVVGVDTGGNFLENERSFNFIQGDFRQNTKKALSALTSGRKEKTAVFHMAGTASAGECEKNPAVAFESNVDLTFHVMEFCRKSGIDVVVYPSTGLVYGKNLEKSISEEESTAPQSLYAATKLSAECIIEGYSKSYGVTCIIARLGNVYGPGCSAGTIVGTIMEQIKSGGNVVVRDLKPVRDFIFVEDVIEGLVRLLVSAELQKCHVVNLSSGRGISIRELSETACRIASIPPCGIKSSRNSKTTDDRIVLDNDRLFELTGWRPAYSISRGLGTMIRDGK